MSNCTICNRVMCDHTPQERGQSYEEMMAEGPRPFVVVAMVDLREEDGKLSIRPMKMELDRYEQLLRLGQEDPPPHAFSGIVFSVSAAAYCGGKVEEFG